MMDGSSMAHGGRVGRAWRSLWRRGLYLHFLLLQRRSYRRLTLETVSGRPIVVLPGVHNPRLFRTGQFLAELLEAPRLMPSARSPVPEGSVVLDMGTGSGVGAIFAAARAHLVVAVDIVPVAVRCARINVLLNQVEDRVAVRLGDLFEPVAGERFDVVLFNPPFFRGEPRTDLERSLYSTDVMERFAAGLSSHLAPGGHAVLVLSSDGDEAGCLAALRLNGFATALIAERDLINEVLRAYLVAPSSP